MDNTEPNYSDTERDFIQQCQQLSDLCEPITQSPLDFNEYLDGTRAGIAKLWERMRMRAGAALQRASSAKVDSNWDEEVSFTVIDDPATNSAFSARDRALEEARTLGLNQQKLQQASQEIRTLANQVAKLAEQILQ